MSASTWSVQSLLDAVKGALVSSAEPADKTLRNIERQLESIYTEVTGLQDEIASLRQRDQSLNFYMSRVDEEMRLAARLQQDFLPKSLPLVGGVRFHTLFRPAGYVSGDLYDVMRLDETHVGFYMADAVGHGMPAALLTMFIKNALTTKEILADGYRLLSPGQTMGKLNDALVVQNLSYATFATAIYGHIDCQTLEVQIARGGHPHPLLMKTNGTIEEVPAEGSLLGIFPDEKFVAATVQLERGDRLLLFTDGIEVAFSPLPDTQQSLTQWRDDLFALRHLPTDQLLKQFADRLDQQNGSLRPKDDLTVIVVDVEAN